MADVHDTDAQDSDHEGHTDGDDAEWLDHPDNNGFRFEAVERADDPKEYRAAAMQLYRDGRWAQNVWVRAAGPVDADEVEVTPTPDAETGSGTCEFDVELTVTAPDQFSRSFSVNFEGGHAVPDDEL